MDEKRSLLDKPLLARLTLNWEMAFYGLILIVALVSRFWDLGSRAQHHDESMHAFYSWNLVRGQGYSHNPLLHGPFLFHATALVYFLFGTSDYTSRVMPAILGVALVFTPYFLRRWLGRYGALATSAMLAISPGFLYFSRFVRHDIFAAFWAMLLFVAIIRYLDGRKDLYLYLACAALALLFSTKEVAFITAFIFGAFLFGLLVWQLWQRQERDPRGLVSYDLVMVLGTLCLPLISALVIRLLGWNPLDYTAAGVRRSAPVVLIILGVSALVGLFWDKRRWPIAATVYYAIFFLLHTTFLTNMLGIATGLVGSLGYWLAQQGVKRGGQPWYYYLILISLYEFLPLFLALLGGARYLLGFEKRVAKSEEDPSFSVDSLFAPFLIYWTGMAFLIYSWAGEKMPWLILHLALPIILLAGHSLGEVIEGTDWHALREGGGWRLALFLPIMVLAAAVFFSSFPHVGLTTLAELNIAMRWLGALVTLAFLVVWAFLSARRLGFARAIEVALFTLSVILAVLTVRYAILASYIHGDIAKEMLIYTQTTPDVTMITREIESLSERLVGGKEMEVAFDDFTSWPFNWYLRDYPNRRFIVDGKGVSEPFQAPVVLVGLENEPQLRPYLVDYIRQQYRLRWWFPENYRGVTWQGIRAGLGDPDLRCRVWRFLLYRELEKPLGSSDFAFYLRRDVASRLWRSSVVPITPPDEEYAEKGIEMTALDIWGGPGVLSYPKDIAFDGEGNLYVVDSGNNRIQVFAPDGRLIDSWGEEGDGPGEFNEPWGVAIDGQGYIYVADTWNHRLQKFDSQGRYLDQWGGFADTEGRAEGMTGLFYGPRDIAVGREGDLYVVDTGNKRIQKFDPQGGFLGQWGGDGSGPGEFREPVGIAIDEEGEIYVADTWNRRFQQFDPDFNLLAQWPVEGWVSESVVNKPYLVADTAGNLYATDPEGFRVMVFDGQGQLLAFFGRYGTDNSSFNLPTGIAVDREGYIYVSDSSNHRIVKFGPLPPVPSSPRPAE